MSDESSQLTNPVVIECPDNFEHGITLEEAQKKDLILANGVVAAVHCAWSQVNSVSGIIKMADATFKAIEHRRHVLGLPYGHQPERGKTIDPNSSQFFSPIK